VSGIVSHAITRDFAHDRTEIIMGNIFSQTDDLYQPEPALQLVPVTPSQGNALRGGASPRQQHGQLIDLLHLVCETMFGYARIVGLT
jgi:hypothetical protein